VPGLQQQQHQTHSLLHQLSTPLPRQGLLLLLPLWLLLRLRNCPPLLLLLLLLGGLLAKTVAASQAPAAAAAAGGHHQSNPCLYCLTQAALSCHSLTNPDQSPPSHLP
jgi:hypothetical protein